MSLTKLTTITLLVLFGVFAGATALAQNNMVSLSDPTPIVPKGKSYVLLNIGSFGHGSGVVIGNGRYILTAGHVADAARQLKTSIEVVSTTGIKSKTTILWQSTIQDTGYDIALLRIDSTNWDDVVESADVSCKAPYIGEAVMAAGNPLQVEWVEMHGQVASAKDQIIAGWLHVRALDLTGGAGMSGGPVFDVKTGKVVGIVVAGYGQISPLMLMVPSSSVCDLLGRTA